MTRYAAIAVAVLCLAGVARPGLASSVCQAGHMVNPQCQTAINKNLKTSETLTDCFQQLDDEYNGTNADPQGRGKNYNEIAKS